MMRKPTRIFIAYTVFTVLSFFLTVAALAYTFAVTNQTKGQSIDVSIVAQFPNIAYPLHKWTPENWTKAMLALPLINQTDINYLNHWLKVMEGWKWNLIPMFLLGLVVASLSVVRCVQQRVMSNVYAK